MERTLWFDELHDHLLDRQELHALELRAAKVYAANPHIFEDEREALQLLASCRCWKPSATTSPCLARSPRPSGAWVQGQLVKKEPCIP